MYSFGSGLLWGLRNDITGQTPIRVGTLQDVDITFDGEIKMLYGQSQYPVDTARGKTKIELKAKSALISAQQYNTLFFGMPLTTGSILLSYNESGSIPAVSTYTITVANGAHFYQDLGVRYAQTGIPLTFLVSGTPTTGQYTLNTTTGVYTFAAADEGLAVYIDYLYTSSTLGFTITGNNPLMGTTPRFMGIFSDQFEGTTITLILPNLVSSKLTFPTKIDDYVINELDAAAFANTAGETFIMSTSASF